METISHKTIRSADENLTGQRVKKFMSAMRPTTEPDEEISLTGAMMCSIMVLNSVIERRGNRLLEEHGLTLPQWLALGCISHGGEKGMTHGEIGQRLMLSKAPITGVVDRLERAELVVRRPDAKDRRVSRVVVTTAGLEMWRRVRDTMRQQSACTVGEMLTPSEQNEFLNLVGRLLDIFAAEDPTLSLIGDSHA